MIIARTVADVRQARERARDRSWGFVPSMGYLHEGHLSLVRRARDENERSAVSIYVNPTQFAPQEDLDSYPRDEARDLALLREAGVDLVFIPSDEEMYPPGFQTTVSVGQVTQLLEGASRPTHFQGVTTVVAKLLNIVQPTRVYFGQKDAQQTVVVRRMIEDLNVEVEMIICPIVREGDGLALSSRNKRLSEAQRAAAPVLYRALRQARDALEGGERDGQRLRALMRQTIDAEPLARLDYVSVADPQTLQELEQVHGPALLSLAVFFGDVRLIDNMPLSTQ